MREPAGPTTTSLAEILRDGARPRHSTVWLRRGLVATTLAGVVLAVLSATGSGPPPPRFATETVMRGPLTATVSATGTLQPTKLVEVGSELSGTLVEVRVTDNDRVRKDQLLARLDTAKLSDSVARSRAAVEVAEAAVAQAHATVVESRTSLARLREVARLSGGKVPSKAELESAEAAALRAAANEVSARATVTQARAALKSDETNLEKAAIRSPIDGVVLARKVEPGQTLVSAMTIPVLFTIAEDLTRMELQVKVDEADVAAVRAGQPATFTVAAWPGRQFPAVTERVGIGSTTTDNVVTYKTVLRVANDDIALRPGMTATATIVTAHRDDATTVPNAALRTTPPAGTVGVPDGILGRLLPHPPSPPPKTAPPPVDGPKMVWVLRDGLPTPLTVKTGISDGRRTEILVGDLSPGTAVITGSLEPAP